MYIILNWYCPAMMSLSRKHVHYVITLYCYMWHYNVILYVKRESLPLQVIRRWKGSMLCLETNKKIYILLLFTQFLQTITVFWIFKKKPIKQLWNASFQPNFLFLIPDGCAKACAAALDGEALFETTALLEAAGAVAKSSACMDS